MGKPVAGRNKLPFGIIGMKVPAVVLKDGTKITDVRISKQRSNMRYDLISSDGKTLYEFVTITGYDNLGNELPLTTDETTLVNLLPNGTFCIPMEVDNLVVGFLRKLLLNKYYLFNGVIYKHNNELDSIKPTIIPVTSITLNKSNDTIIEYTRDTLIATILPENATDKTVTWVADPGFINIDQEGNLQARHTGTSTVKAISSNNLVATCVYDIISAGETDNG